MTSRTLRDRLADAQVITVPRGAVGTAGSEPATSCTQGRRAARLRYVPWSGELLRPGRWDSRPDMPVTLLTQVISLRGAINPFGCRATAHHVELAGIEPAASSLRRKRATNCAIAPSHRSGLAVRPGLSG
jgi:hypothetical protein